MYIGDWSADVCSSELARTITFAGLWMAMFAFGVIWVARQIPAAPFSPIPQAVFDQVFGGANRIFFDSMVAYLAGQMLDRIGRASCREGGGQSRVDTRA